MLWRFLIHKDGGPVVAELSYNWDTDKYSCIIADDAVVSLNDLPVVLYYHVTLNDSRVLSDEQCRLFIRGRVIPAGRHNIGMILRDMGVPYYHECFMMRYMPRSDKDEFLTEFLCDAVSL